MYKKTVFLKIDGVLQPVKHIRKKSKLIWGVHFIEMLALFLTQEKLSPEDKCVRTQIHDTFIQRIVENFWLVCLEQRQSVAIRNVCLFAVLYFHFFSNK